MLKLFSFIISIAVISSSVYFYMSSDILDDSVDIKISDISGSSHLPPPIMSINDLIITTEHLPPSNFINKHNQKVGIHVDIIVALFERSGSKIKRDDIQFSTWARAFNNLQQMNNIALFTTSKTKERNGMFKWVGPLSFYVNTLVVKKSKNIVIKNNKELLQYKLGAVRDTFDEKSLIEKGVPHSSITIVNQPQQLVDMLITDRIDGFVYSEQIAKYLLIQSGQNIEHFDFSYELNTSDLYLALSKNVPNHVVDKLQKTLDKMKADKKYYQAFFDKYLTAEN